MKKILKYIAVAFIASTVVSCSDYLDKEYDASLSEEKIFSNADLTREFLANIYTNLPDGFAPLNDSQFFGASRDCMTDNSTSWWSLHVYDKIGSDVYTSADHPLLGFWASNLSAIRKCNIFLRSVNESVVSTLTSDNGENIYVRYKAEATLLRALFHFDLLCWFGDIPIIGDDESGNPIVFDLSDSEAMNMTRTDIAEALEWVAGQCDAVKDVLPFRYTNEASNWGRVNGAAAYALKSRALLYRASTLHNPSGEKTLWQDAADAATDFIAKNESEQTTPYALSDIGDVDSNYGESFTTNPVYNNEFILSRSVWDTNVIESSFMPVGFTGSFTATGRTNPTQNFVDCFETINGLPIEDDNSYDEDNPYVNRDPRLNQIVFYQGSIWGRADKEEEREIDMRYNSETDMGIDYKSAHGGTLTGYYLKKFVNNISAKDPSTFSHAWPIFRYAEILLNAAEALNEAKGAAYAYEYINEIRERSGMPAYSSMSDDVLRERIRNERRIELCFEDHRFLDVRRWALFDGVTATSEASLPRYQQVYNLYGVRITGEASDPVLTYGLAETNFIRVFTSPKNNYFPIPRDEVKRAPALGQNEGW